MADPFVPSAQVVALLRLRARQLGRRSRPIRRLQLQLTGTLTRLRRAEGL